MLPELQLEDFGFVSYLLIQKLQNLLVILLFIIKMLDCVPHPERSGTYVNICLDFSKYKK